jgi:outer membrane autotransporter protein
MANGSPALSRLPAFERTEGGWSAWGRALGMTGSMDSDDGRLGFDIDGYGIALGVDNQVGKNLVLGIGAGYTSSDVDFDDNGQSTDVDGYHVSLYGTYSTPAFYLDAAVLYGGNSYDTDRLTPGGKVTSDPDGSQFALYLGGGYNMVKDADWFFIPTAGVQWAKVDIDGFTEKGASPYNLKVDDFDTDSFVTTLGFRVGTSMMMGSAKVTPEFRLAWGHEFGDTDRDVSATFASLGGPSFTVNGVEPDEDSALVGVGVNANMSNNMTLFLDYDGEFRSDFNSHTVSGGLRWKF